MTLFEQKLSELYQDFGMARKMVLSTSLDGIVSSRMMSVVLIDGLFCFQTDRNMRKYAQLTGNPHAALCIDNIQIEGICRETGSPLENEKFRKAFEECYKGSYDMYSSMEDERSFALAPLFIERWLYIDGKPYTETFDIKNGSYSLTEYKV